MADKHGKRGSSGGRGLKVRVKTARRRSASSTRWLERQLNDPYVARARDAGYRARSAFKLIEIDDRYHLLAPGKRVVDLGAAPGGWSRIAAERVRSTDADPLVVAVDYLDMDPLPGVIVIKKDFLDDDAPDAIRAALGGHGADIVLSDMAAPTTGHRRTDHLRTVHLCEVAADFGRTLRRQGVSRRHRGRTADAAQAQFRFGPPRQAAGEPGGIGRALPGCQRLSRQTGHMIPRDSQSGMSS